MHLAQIIDVGNIDASGIATPTHQQVCQIGLLIGKIVLRPLQQIDTICVVVAGDIITLFAITYICQTGLEQQVHCTARHLMMGIVLAILVAAASVVEMRQIELVDALFLHQLQQFRQISRIVAGQGEAHTHLDAAIQAQSNTVHGFIESAFLATEHVMRLAHAVNADTNVVVVDIRNGIDITLIDKRTVGRQTRIETHFLRTAGDIKDIRTKQRLATGKDQYRDLEGMQIVHHAVHFFGR